MNYSQDYSDIWHRDIKIGLNKSLSISFARLIVAEESSVIESTALNVFRLFSVNNLSRDFLIISTSGNRTVKRQ